MLVKLFSRLLKWDWFFEVVDGCVESHAKERRLRLEDLRKSLSEKKQQKSRQW